MNALAAECVGSSNPATVTISPEDFAHLLKMAHGEPSLPSAALAYSGISTPHPPLQGKRLIDSGTTYHMTSIAHFFVTYSPFRQPLFVSLTDGIQVPVIGKRKCLYHPQYVFSRCAVCALISYEHSIS